VKFGEKKLWPINDPYLRYSFFFSKKRALKLDEK
jgi:hypothetical protein